MDGVDETNVVMLNLDGADHPPADADGPSDRDVVAFMEGRFAQVQAKGVDQCRHLLGVREISLLLFGSDVAAGGDGGVAPLPSAEECVAFWRAVFSEVTVVGPDQWAKVLVMERCILARFLESPTVCARD